MDILIKNTNFNIWSEHNWRDWLENFFIHDFISPIDLSLRYGMEVREMMTYLFKNDIETSNFEKAIINLISEYLQFESFTYRIYLLIDGLYVSRLSESEDLMLKIYKDVNLGKKSHNGLFLSTKVIQHFREKNTLKKDIKDTLLINSRSYLFNVGELSLAFLNNYLSFLNKHFSPNDMINFLIEYTENYNISNTKEVTKIKVIIYDKLLEITYSNEADSITIIYNNLLNDFRRINNDLFHDALMKLKDVMNNRLSRVIEPKIIDAMKLAINIVLKSNIDVNSSVYYAVRKIYDDLGDDNERLKFFSLNKTFFENIINKVLGPNSIEIQSYFGTECFKFFKASSADLKAFILGTSDTNNLIPYYSKN